jgi:hypothetical protein
LPSVASLASSSAVEAIRIAGWSADDWNVAIREPSLVSDEPLGPDQLAEWRALLAKA